LRTILKYLGLWIQSPIGTFFKTTLKRWKIGVLVTSCLLNVSKCFYVRYSKRLINVLSSYSISSHVNSLRNESLDIGVMFDTKFTFIDHINYIIPKAYAMYGFVKRNSTQFKDPYTKLSLFSSFIRSGLEYALFVSDWYYTHHSYWACVEPCSTGTNFHLTCGWTHAPPGN